VVSDSPQIVVCDNPQKWRAFENAAEFIFGASPAFVPPFPGAVERFLKPESSYFLRHGPIRAFLAYKDGRIVGRLAAIINRSHNIYHGDRTGFFGFPAFVDDPTVASALFDAAEQWLRLHGCDRIRGPYNPTINEDCGLLLDAEELPPVIGTTWNPLHMVTSVESCGFTQVREMQALLLDLTIGEPERVRKVRERVARKNFLTLRHFRMNRLNEEVEILGRLYNQTLDRNWGFVPVSYMDFLESAREFRAITDPELILIAESRGIPAAFVINFPDFHEILLSARKWPRALRLPAILAGIKTQKIRKCRLAVLGVAPAFRDMGLTGWLFGEQQLRTSARFTHCEISWVESNNTEILENSKMMGCVPYRKYGIFEKQLSAPAPVG
jgi:hypothetical protein